MDKHERFLAKLAELAREYEAPLRGQELVRSRLLWEDWGTLRPEAVEFAREEIRRRKWRGMRDGLLPGGYDAEDVADQTIEELLSGKGRIAFGFTRERVVKELQRLVSRRVRGLHGLREAAAVRSEWEAGVPEAGAEAASVLEGMPDEREDDREAETEGTETLAEKKKAVAKHLDGEPDLRAVFECLCAGMTRPGEIAQRLGIAEAEVAKVRKRLERRLAEFGRNRKR